MSKPLGAIDIKEAQRTDRSNCGIVYVLDDLEHAFSEWLLNQVTEWFLEGLSPEEIGKKLHRDPDEIFLALFHQARKGVIQTPFAYRL